MLVERGEPHHAAPCRMVGLAGARPTLRKWNNRSPVDAARGADDAGVIGGVAEGGGEGEGGFEGEEGADGGFLIGADLKKEVAAGLEQGDGGGCWALWRLLKGN